MSYVILKIVSKLAKNGFTIHEANVAQAAGSIAGLIGAAVVFTVPSIVYLEEKYGLIYKKILSRSMGEENLYIYQVKPRIDVRYQ